MQTFTLSRALTNTLLQILLDAKSDSIGRIGLLERNVKPVPMEQSLLDNAKKLDADIDKLIETFNIYKKETVSKGKPIYTAEGVVGKFSRLARCQDCASFVMGEDMERGAFKYYCKQNCYILHPSEPACKNYKEQ